jgi:hypothetical protein
MNRLRIATSTNTQRLLTSFLLVGLLFCPGAASGAKNPASPREGESTPTSIGAAPILNRNYALTTLPDQRTAGHAFKENRVKHLVTPSGPARRVADVNVTIVHQLLVVTDRSVLYLSFRLSRPGGRAPPTSA